MKMFIYFLKKTIRDRSFVFWTLMFPLALMTCFKFAFSNIYSANAEFDPVKAVYVNEDDISIEELLLQFLSENGLDDVAKEIFSAESLSEIRDLYVDGKYDVIMDNFEKGIYNEEEIREELDSIVSKYAEDDLLDNINISDEMLEKLDILSYGIIFNLVADNSDCFELSSMNTLDEARQALLNDEAKIIFIVKDKDVRIEMSKEYSTIDANVATAFLTTYKTEYQIIREMLLEMDFENVSDTDTDIKAQFDETFGNEYSMKEIAKQKADIYGAEPDPFNWYYYSTIVMGIMFNILTGIGIVRDAQADISTGAMRISLSSTKKSKLLLSMFLSRFVLCFAITVIQIIVANYVFEIPMGRRIPELILFVSVANLFALSVGQMCGLFFKGRVSDRENKANALLMTSVFLSGEMVNVLPGIFAVKAPWINAVNPATILNFAFYKLVYYEQLDSFYLNMVKIAAVTVVFLCISIIRMRRQKYASV